jgi:hypothetical protein
LQVPPFTSWTISLWLAVTAVILLITVQLASSYDGPGSLLVNVKGLKYAALATGLLFLATVAIRIYEIIATT